ncbi:MAG: hypothetical protein K2P88_07315 [Chitinophagaceae bacterium]|uniref:hypothetical protein n=1 Tax=unclassified Paraflavitalea TaxID=2798305 RepID=UPI003D3437FE|nr:hypothetical protein [Chitinophagaceae bacterium]
MNTFKPDSRLQKQSELKYWLEYLVLLGIVVLVSNYVFMLTTEKIALLLSVLLLIRIADRITQYYVSQIEIDKEEANIKIVLESILSGTKVREYEFNKIKIELVEHSGLRKYTGSPFELLITVESGGLYKIGNRYGYNINTLKEIERAVRM